LQGRFRPFQQTRRLQTRTPAKIRQFFVKTALRCEAGLQREDFRLSRFLQGEPHGLDPGSSGDEFAASMVGDVFDIC
jgi:hypothetical protein